MQLVCMYGTDKSDPLGGFVLWHTDDDSAVVDMTKCPGCVLIPFQGSIESLGKSGPEPRLLGSPPTETYPTHDEIDQGVSEGHFSDARGKTRLDFLRSVAGTKVPDQRVEKGLLPDDTRHYRAPDQSQPQTLKAYLNQVRYQRETGGLEVSGVVLKTDRESQSALERYASRAARDPSFSVDWVVATGETHPMDAKALVAASDAVGDYAQALRSAATAVSAEIDSGSVKTFSAVDDSMSARVS